MVGAGRDVAVPILPALLGFAPRAWTGTAPVSLSGRRASHLGPWARSAARALWTRSAGGPGPSRGCGRKEGPWASCSGWVRRGRQDRGGRDGCAPRPPAWWLWRERRRVKRQPDGRIHSRDATRASETKRASCRAGRGRARAGRRGSARAQAVRASAALFKSAEGVSDGVSRCNCRGMGETRRRRSNWAGRRDGVSRGSRRT